ncbi:hypothetical protein J5N97_020873 [Dioscorea zingiberensis]|uniref:GDSL esterase/lipase n=1 Tax=Dioscorea zingiberensis TaxID=325984 RepID=A0A9D5CHE0_9LILI|nr:hypothetical protein J5N97_020873 [Dioscorea zingiberensis]
MSISLSKKRINHSDDLNESSEKEREHGTTEFSRKSTDYARAIIQRTLQKHEQSPIKDGCTQSAGIPVISSEENEAIHCRNENGQDLSVQSTLTGTIDEQRLESAWLQTAEKCMPGSLSHSRPEKNQIHPQNGTSFQGDMVLRHSNHWDEDLNQQIKALKACDTRKLHTMRKLQGGLITLPFLRVYCTVTTSLLILIKKTWNMIQDLVAILFFVGILENQTEGSLGDSNSDTGGFSAAFGPLTSPFGETFFHEPAGRFSDGRLIIDFIAESLGLPYLSSYLDSIGSNFSHGANFATSLSTVIPQNITLSQGGYSPFSLDIQAMQFSQFKSRSQIIYRKGKFSSKLTFIPIGGVLKSLMPMKKYFSRALYILDIGQNDLTALFYSNKSADQYIPDAMKAFSSSIKSLYEEGGRYFWIHNTGPLGCLPYVLWQDPKELDSLGCAIVFNELAKKFNRMLNETVAQLRKDFPVAAFTYVDIYSAKYLLISQANKFGFKKPLMACCGHGGGLYNYDPKARCGTSIKKKGSQVLIGKSCMDSRKRVNWDGAHYTEAANKWVFDQIVTGDFSDPPNSLNMACYKHNTL